MDERKVGLQPLDDTAIGCTLAFTATGPMYQPMSALAVLAALNGKAFTGVCECYLRPDVRDGEYLMGVGLVFGGEPPPDEWWSEFDRRDIRVPLGGTPGWQTLNIRAGIDFKRFGQMTLGVYNIFDQNYRIHGSGLDAPGVEFRGGYQLKF